MDHDTIAMFSREAEQSTFLAVFLFEEGSPWSASEPSIEPEGMSRGQRGGKITTGTCMASCK